MSMRLIHKGQKGFTLVELVIVVALAGIVGVAITATAFQVFTFSTRLSNQMTAIRQVQQAGFWVSPDVMMSNTTKINVNQGEGKFLVLGWTAQDGKDHEVDYILESMLSGDLNLTRLTRKHYIGTGTPLALNSTTTVAEYISSASFALSESAYTFNVTATVGGQTETRTYEVKPRVGT